MPAPAQLQKAFILTETGDRVNCMFNPEKFAFNVTNRWEGPKVPGKEIPTLSYTGGSAGTFNLDLVFDTTRVGTTVTAHTNLLLGLMKVNTKLPGLNSGETNGRPPWVKFMWGTHIRTFRSIIKTMAVSFTYFSSAGLPLRANVNMTLEQLQPDQAWGRQNPTSGTPSPNRTHQVRVGDTLDRVAALYYGDSTKWRPIASVNGITDPLTIRPGQLLAIPERVD